MVASLWSFVTLALLASAALGCDKRPPIENLRAKKRGDAGYSVRIGSDPSGYMPGKVYTLLLLGQRTHERLQQFTHFTLTAKAARGPNKRTGSAVAGPKRVGRFQLFSDALTKFNENCVNTVSEADDFPKTEIQVLWRAPVAGSGCVALSAMVYEAAGAWYSDDGQLTKIICEATPDETTKKPECCACDEAKYSFVFEGIWSNETHPKDFPFAIWLTHFSDVIGASHDSDFSFWGENHIATDGFRSLAEFGSPRALEQELRGKGNRLRTLIKAAGLWYPHVNTNTSSHFWVDRKNHKVSMVSMFGPSPDWVVGISGLNLCKVDCSWLEGEDFDLYPWDAGTDNGITYMSPNSETQPRERMTRITTMYPEDPRAPFYNPKSDSMVPLAKLYIRKERTVAKSCDAEFLRSQILDVAENGEEDIQPECETTEWGQYTPCSVTCGKGIQSRSRTYKLPDVAVRAGCQRQLIAKEMCVAAVPECEGDQGSEDGHSLTQAAATVNEDGEGTGICKTTKWSEWSTCSASCGIGITMRTRTFVDHQGRKKCPHITIVEKEKCMQPECSISNMEVPDPTCPTTIWSDWSPCSTNCGKGVQIRTRLLLVEPSLKPSCESRVELNQQRPCAEQADCSLDPTEARQICQQPPKTGPCRASYTRFAYNPSLRSCQGFTYGGCRGNKNNFLTQEDCLQVCGNLFEDQTETRSENNLEAPVDCQLSGWTDWSPCSATCGVGRSEKYRYVIQEAENGGQSCPEKRVFKRRKCYAPPCE